MQCDGSERSRRRRAPLRRALLGALATAALVIAGAVALPGAAWADDYPTWDDVKNAQANEQSKQAEVTRIQGLLDGMRAEVAAAQALSQQRGEEYNRAQAAFDTAAYKAGELEAQATEAQERADASNRQAGQLAAQLGRVGNSDLTVSLIAGGGASGSDDLLYQLGTMSMLTSKTSQIYAQAEQDSNTAAALSAQAEVARAELEKLAAEAQRLRDEAVSAQKAAESALAEQQDHEVELQTQLQVLTQNRQATEADYQKGVEARAEAARQAMLAGLPTLPFIAASGWASPFPGGYSSDEYGMRVNPVSGAYLMHSGIDLVVSGGSCGVPVYAAAEGIVEYAGWNGGYGNFVEIDHGGGISTGYGHNSQLLVGVGAYVQPGQPIALAGTTGNSTGCHVHYEVRQNGSGINPRSFMQAVGIEFG